MGRVFSGASDVVVWLGKSTTNVDELALYMHERSVVDKKDNSKRGNTPSSSTETGLRHAEDPMGWKANTAFALAEPERYEKIWQGTHEVLSSPYFSRMWTYQEWCLARREPTLICGRHEFNFQEVLKHDIRIKKSRYIRENWKTRVLLPTDSSTFSVTINAYRLSGRSARGSKDKCSLFQLLHETELCTCEDPRDKLYALYGMAVEAAGAIPPDYGKPLSQVAMEAVGYLLKEYSGDFSTVMDFFELRSTRLHDKSWPSWLPDILPSETTTSPARDIHFEDPMCDALLKDGRCTRIVDQSLICRGRSLGPARIRHRFLPRQKCLDLYIQDLITLLRCQITFPNWSKQALVLAFLSTNIEAKFLLEGQDSEGSSPHDSVISNLNYVVQSKGAWYHLLPDLYEKVFFATSDEGFGITTGLAEDGDILVLIPQMNKCPTSLRCEQGCSKAKLHTPCHCPKLLVGFAYVNGIMDNESHDENMVTKILKETEVEELVLV